jgi:hypothetical protein
MLMFTHHPRSGRHSPAKGLVRLALVLASVTTAGIAFVPAAGASTTATGLQLHSVTATAPETIGECYDYIYDSAGEAYCSGTQPSQFRVWLTCTGGYLRYGPWKFAGDSYTSYVNCPTNTFAVDIGWETT